MNILDAAASCIDDYVVRKAGVLQHSSMGLFGKKRAYHHLETPNLQEVFLSEPNTILTGKQGAPFCFLPPLVLFQEIHVFLQISWINLLNKMYLSPPGCLHLRERCLSKTKSVLTEKKPAICCKFKYRRFSLKRCMCVLNSSECACLEHIEPITTLKHVSSRKCSFQTLTQFSQYNKVIDATLLH
jgi:hypothetical protein